MAFFDELSKKAQAYAGVAVEKARDLADTASEKARAAADSAKISMAISTEQREMEKNYRAIGEWFVSEYEGEIPDAVKDVVAAVFGLKEKIAELEASSPRRRMRPRTSSRSSPWPRPRRPARLWREVRQQVLPRVRRADGRILRQQKGEESGALLSFC